MLHSALTGKGTTKKLVFSQPVQRGVTTGFLDQGARKKDTADLTNGSKGGRGLIFSPRFLQSCGK